MPRRLVAACLLLLFVAPLRAQDGPLWDIEAAWLLLERAHPRSAPIIQSFNGSTAFNASQFDFNYENGFEVAMARRVAPGWAAQLRYFQVDGFESHGNVELEAGNIVGTDTGSGLMALSDFSRLYSAEANLVTATVHP